MSQCEKCGPTHARKRMGTKQDKEQNDENLTAHRSNRAAEGVVDAGQALC